MAKQFVVLLIALLFLSCAPVKTVITEQNKSEYNTVIDSIKRSGTIVGPLKTWSFITDDNRQDQVIVGTLYKDQKSTGSIQIRKIGDVYNIKIIDVIKEGKK